VAAELFHADGRTGMTKQIVAFLIIAKAHKNRQLMLHREIICLF
jgi:hypothetical protein